jgi:hypothetical protein
VSRRSKSLQDSLAAGVQPAQLGVEQRERLRRRILEQARDQAPEGTRTLRADESVDPDRAVRRSS